MIGGRRFRYSPAVYNRRAAERVVPWLIERYAPQTVIDVGCGTGSWAAVFLENGCAVIGMDREDVPDGLLEIPRERFRVVDFEQQLEPEAHFDLALCLEVAEHLTAPGGERLVRYLTRVADVVLFSAAVPGQGGQHHLTERWPCYWQDRFSANQYVCEDEIRWVYWDDDQIEWWYRQNMFVARPGTGPSRALPAVIHPALFEAARNDIYQGRIGLRAGVMVFVRSLAAAVRRGARRSRAQA